MVTQKSKCYFISKQQQTLWHSGWSHDVLPRNHTGNCILGSTPGKTILWKYSKIASGLSRIYNTVSIPVKFFPFKLRALFYHQYHLPLYQIQLMWHSGYGPCATKFPINSLWVQYWVKSFYQIIQRLPQGCP